MSPESCGEEHQWRTSTHLAGVCAPRQVACADHARGDEALVNLRPVAGLVGEEGDLGCVQRQAGLACRAQRGGGRMEGGRYRIV